MNLRRLNQRVRPGLAGWTLPEIMIATLIAALLMAAVGSFTLYGLRSFVAMSNYADLEEKSRRAVDELTRQVRQATAVIDVQTNGTTRWLTLTNSTSGATVKYMKYTWVSNDRVLYYERTGQPAVTNLSECDSWEFTLHMRAPIPGTTNQFYPATNYQGKLDFNVAKLVEMRWKCSRQMLGKAFHTESVQTTKIVLRNRQ